MPCGQIRIRALPGEASRAHRINDRLARLFSVAVFTIFSTLGVQPAAAEPPARPRKMSLRMERAFSAPREAVYGWWTDPHAVAKWFLSPEEARWRGFPKFEARRGAWFTLKVMSEHGDYELHGMFREVRPPEKLVLHWEWGKQSPITGSTGAVELTLRFLDEKGKTKIVLTQTGFRNEESRRWYERGWHRCFDQMEHLLRSAPPRAARPGVTTTLLPGAVK
jgi:uncharacterized protein YndB with AHSA1/START domain